MYAYPPSHACAAESENPSLFCICSFVAHRYRTPQAFRAFTRVYLLLAGALYGPYFVELGLGNTVPGPAFSAGIRSGDRILAVDDSPVTNFNQISEAV